MSPTVAALADVGIVTESAPEPAKGSVAVRLYAPAPAPYGVPKPSMARARGEEKWGGKRVFVSSSRGERIGESGGAVGLGPRVRERA